MNKLCPRIIKTINSLNRLATKGLRNYNLMIKIRSIYKILAFLEFKSVIHKQ